MSNIINPLLDTLLQTTLDIAEKAAKFIREESEKVRRVDFKGATDLVTQADRGSENLIVDGILSRFPNHNILTEESEGQYGKSPYTWIIDPLDGTTNFVHNYPFYAVSIAVHYEETPVLGVVVDICHHYTFSAIAGQGSTQNGKSISISNTRTLKHSLLATGFPYVHDEIWSQNMDYFKHFTNLSQGVRRAGAASLDLCHVACGWLDGFWELELNPWDTAAGSLIVEEAGGNVTRLDGNPFSIYNNQILASNGRIHQEIVEESKNA